MPGSTSFESNGYLSCTVNGGAASGTIDLNTTYPTSRTTLRRVNDELRDHVIKLRTELLVEKAKSKQIHREKVAYVKRLKDDFVRDKSMSLQAVHVKMKSLHESEVRKLRESLVKDKELEIAQIIKYKDEELRTVRKHLLEERDLAVKETEARVSKEYFEKTRSESSESEKRLRHEMLELKKSKEIAEQMLQTIVVADTERSNELRRLKEENEKELQKIVRESRKENLKYLNELKSAQKALQDKDSELKKIEGYLSRLQEENSQLVEKVRDTDKLNLSKSSSSKADLISVTKSNSTLSLDNSAILSERTQTRIKDLKRRNAELVAIARKLEEKAQAVQKENAELKSQSIHNTSVNTSVDQTLPSLRIRSGLEGAQDKAAHGGASTRKTNDLLESSGPALEEGLLIGEENRPLSELEDMLKLERRERLRLERQVALLQSADHEVASGVSLSGRDDPLEPALTVFTESRDSGTKALRSLEEKNARLKAELENLSKLHAVCSKKNEELLSKVEQIEKLKTEVVDQERECSQLMQTVDAKDVEISHLKRELQVLELERHSLVSESTSYKQQLQACDAKVSSLQVMVDEGAEIRKKCTGLEVRLETTLKALDALQGKHDSLVEQVNSLRQAEQAHADLKVKFESLEREALLSRTEILRKESLINELKKEQVKSQEKLQKTVDVLKESIRNVEVKYRNLEEEHASVSAELASARKRIRRGEDVEHKMCQASVLSLDKTCQSDGFSALRHKAVQTDFSTSHASTQTGSATAAAIVDGHDRPALRAVQETTTSEIMEPVEAASDEADLFSSWNALHPSARESIAGHSTLALEGPEHAFFDEVPHRPPSGSVLIRRMGQDRDVMDVSSGRSRLSSSNGTSEELSLLSENIIEMAASRINELAVSFSEGSRLENPDESNASDVSLQKEGSRESSSTTPDDAKHVTSNPPSPIKSIRTEDSFNSKKLGFHGRADAELLRPATGGDVVGENSERNLEDLDSDDSVADDEAEEADESFDSAIALEKLFDKFRKSGNGEIRMFVAQYAYDPYHHSPNDRPELELPLQFGDFVYVYGDMDEDGFYLAELPSGARGLVPSNMVTRITEEEHEDGFRVKENSFMEEDLTEAEYLALTYSKKSDGTFGLDDSSLVSGYDLEADDEVRSGEDGVRKRNNVPPPQKVTLERQLTNSVVIGWCQPNGINDCDVKGYAVYVDGNWKQTVLGSGRTKALLSDIDSNKVHRISVRTISVTNEESMDPQAILTVGSGALNAPTGLVVSNLTTVSAEISWLPANSSYSHVVFLDEEEVHVAKPGTFKCSLPKLQPSTDYDVCVRAWTGDRKPSFDACGGSSLRFRTPDGGPPEAPMNVIAYVTDLPLRSRFPSRSTALHVSWIPVTIGSGTSNGSFVTGYQVYINNRPCSEALMSEEDSVSLSSDAVAKILRMQNELENFLTVRTQSAWGESIDSNKVKLSPEIFAALFPDGELTNSPTDNDPASVSPTTFDKGANPTATTSSQPTSIRDMIYRAYNSHESGSRHHQPGKNTLVSRETFPTLQSSTTVAKLVDKFGENPLLMSTNGAQSPVLDGMKSKLPKLLRSPQGSPKHEISGFDSPKRSRIPVLSPKSETLRHRLGIPSDSSTPKRPEDRAEKSSLPGDRDDVSAPGLEDSMVATVAPEMHFTPDLELLDPEEKSEQGDIEQVNSCPKNTWSHQDVINEVHTDSISATPKQNIYDWLLSSNILPLGNSDFDSAVNDVEAGGEDTRNRAVPADAAHESPDSSLSSVAAPVPERVFLANEAPVWHTPSYSGPRPRSDDGAGMASREGRVVIDVDGDYADLGIVVHNLSSNRTEDDTQNKKKAAPAKKFQLDDDDYESEIRVKSPDQSPTHYNPENGPGFTTAATSGRIVVSDGELSAIEEETDEDILDYNDAQSLSSLGNSNDVGSDKDVPSDGDSSDGDLSDAVPPMPVAANEAIDLRLRSDVGYGRPAVLATGRSQFSDYQGSLNGLRDVVSTRIWEKNYCDGSSNGVGSVTKARSSATFGLDEPPEALDSTELTSTEVVALVELDAQRDIIGEYPEFPDDSICQLENSSVLLEANFHHDAEAARELNAADSYPGLAPRSKLLKSTRKIDGETSQAPKEDIAGGDAPLGSLNSVDMTGSEYGGAAPAGVLMLTNRSGSESSNLSEGDVEEDSIESDSRQFSSIKFSNSMSSNLSASINFSESDGDEVAQLLAAAPPGSLQRPSNVHALLNDLRLPSASAALDKQHSCSSEEVVCERVGFDSKGKADGQIGKQSAHNEGEVFAMKAPTMPPGKAVSLFSKGDLGNESGKPPSVGDISSNRETASQSTLVASTLDVGTVSILLDKPPIPRHRRASSSAMEHATGGNHKLENPGCSAASEVDGGLSRLPFGGVETTTVKEFERDLKMERQNDFSFLQDLLEDIHPPSGSDFDWKSETSRSDDFSAAHQDREAERSRDRLPLTAPLHIHPWSRSASANSSSHKSILDAHPHVPATVCDGDIPVSIIGAPSPVESSHGDVEGGLPAISNPLPNLYTFGLAGLDNDAFSPEKNDSELYQEPPASAGLRNSIAVGNDASGSLPVRIFIANFTYDPATMSPNTELLGDELPFKEGDLLKVFGEAGDDGFFYGELNGQTGFIPSNMVTELSAVDIDVALGTLGSASTQVGSAEADGAGGTTEVLLPNHYVSHEHLDSFDLSPLVEKPKTLNLYGTLAKSQSSGNLLDQSLTANHTKSISLSVDRVTDPVNYHSEGQRLKFAPTSSSMPDVVIKSSESAETNLSPSKGADPYKLPSVQMIALYDYDPVVNSPNVDSEIELTFRAGEIITIYGDVDEDLFFAGKLNGRKGLVPSNFVRKALPHEIKHGSKKWKKSKTASALPEETDKESPKIKKKTSFLSKSKKIFSKLKAK